MNMWIKKEERKTFWMQVGAWAAMFVLPTFTSWLVTHSSDMAWLVARDALPVTLCFALIFFLNVYWLTPEYLFKIKIDTLTITDTPWYKELSEMTNGVSVPFESGEKTARLVEAATMARGSLSSRRRFDILADSCEDEEMRNVFTSYLKERKDEGM